MTGPHTTHNLRFLRLLTLGALAPSLRLLLVTSATNRVMASGIETNNVTVFDFLGRAAATVRPGANAVASYAYQISLLGVATNETTVLGGETFMLARQVDQRHRLSALSVGSSLHAAYAHDAEGRQVIVSNDVFSVTYAYTSDGRDAGYTVSLTNGLLLSRTVTRDPYRRHLVTAITNGVDGVPMPPLVYGYDLLNRVTGRNTDSFSYNARSEVTSAIISNTVAAYVYDGIGNRLAATNNAVATLYATTPLNQYTNILCASAPPRETFLAYDLDGNLQTNGVWSYTWDAENRLVAAYSNATQVVSNAYDHASRRVLKVTPSAMHTYLYDGWNLIRETIHNQQSSITNLFVWGKDLSGTLQGAGGVGGLLVVSVAGVVDPGLYFPFYDHNGNITAYVDEEGSVVAEYLYDAFGRSIEASGPMSDSFPHRFSTKYFDSETGLYYYGYRFYCPELGRWMNRDPIEEEGGLNLYGFIENSTSNEADYLGLSTIKRIIEPEDWERMLNGESPISVIGRGLNDGELGVLKRLKKQRAEKEELERKNRIREKSELHRECLYLVLEREYYERTPRAGLAGALGFTRQTHRTDRLSDGDTIPACPDIFASVKAKDDEKCKAIAAAWADWTKVYRDARVEVRESYTGFNGPYSFTHNFSQYVGGFNPQGQTMGRCERYRIHDDRRSMRILSETLYIYLLIDGMEDELFRLPIKK